MNNRLNAEIATRVMGWKLNKVRINSSHHYIDKHGPEEIKIDHFYPSEQIADAWIVLDEMQRKFGGFNLSKTKNNGFECSILWWNHNAYDVIATEEASTAPEAICMAALRAVGPK